MCERRQPVQGTVVVSPRARVRLPPLAMVALWGPAARVGCPRTLSHLRAVQGPPEHTVEHAGGRYRV